eukprot:3967450-Pyramimonas_sp.AAC.1
MVSEAPLCAACPSLSVVGCPSGVRRGSPAFLLASLPCVSAGVWRRQGDFPALLQCTRLAVQLLPSVAASCGATSTR